MPYTPDLVKTVIDSLNRKNVATLAKVKIDPVNIQLVSVVYRDETTLDVTVAGKGPIASYGQVTAQVKKQSIASYFTAIPVSKLPPRTTVHALLPDLQQILGLTFLPQDFVDLPINWQNGQAVITFQSTPTSLFWYGTTDVTVVSSEVDIATVFTITSLTVSAKSCTRAEWITQLETAAKRQVDESKITVSAPMTLAEAGVSNASFNTVIRLTAKPNSGYTGTKDIFYNRVDLNQFKGLPTAVPDDFTGTIVDALAIDNIGIRPVLSLDELDIGSITGDWPKQATISAKPGSYKTFGTAEISVIRYGDSVQTLTITAATAMEFNAAYWKSLIDNRARCGRLLMNITINQNISVWNDTVSNATLELKEFPQIGEIICTIVNRGNFCGRGGNGASYATPLGGADGGTAISISDNFRGKLIIDNYGTIAGGGGGGEMCLMGSYAVSGGGGAPRGTSPAPGLGTYQATSQNASDTFGGSPASLTYNGSGYRQGYVGGRGGDIGNPGQVAVMHSYNILGSNLLFTGSTLAGYPFRIPGQPGKAIDGKLDKVTWLNKGTVLPPVVDEYQEFLAYLDTLNATRLGNTDVFSAFVGKSTAVIVDLAGFVNGTRTSPSSNSGDYLYGAPWGGPFALDDTRALALLWHCMPKLETMFDNFFLNRKVLVELAPEAVGAVGSDLRNGLQSRSNGSPVKRGSVVRCVYYDAFLGKMMQTKPKAQVNAQPWVRPPKLLSALNGELDGFIS